MIGGRENPNPTNPTKPTTPIHMNTQLEAPVQSPCEEFYDLIAKFHNTQINTSTLRTNDPNFAQNLEELLQSQGTIILTFLQTNQIPDDIEPELKELLGNIQTIDRPYNCEEEVLKEYIVNMFIKFSFTLTSQHIQNLKKKLFDDENLSEE
jgi:hypothetical protein